MEICVVCGDMRSDMGMGFHDVVRAMQMLISIRACQWQRAYHTHAPIFFVHETETVVSAWTRNTIPRHFCEI